MFAFGASGGSRAATMWLLLVLHTAPIAAWSNSTQQARFMRRAIELALGARAAGNDPYGAVIADPTRGVIVAEGANHAARDPIWHGEMAAIHNLSRLSAHSVYDIAASLELYTTAEPCPMCMSAIEWAGFGAVIYGTSIPHIAAHGAAQISLRAAEVAQRAPAPPFHNISLVGGILANETDPLYADPRRTGGAHTHVALSPMDAAAQAVRLGERLRHAVSASFSQPARTHDDDRNVATAATLPAKSLLAQHPAGITALGATGPLSSAPDGAATVPADTAADATRVLVVYHSDTNRTAALAQLICAAAAREPSAVVRCVRVSAVTCDDLTWSDGMALGSPVYWATMSAPMKTFLDDVQQRCFSWPITQLAWRAGAAFTTGAHVASGKESTLAAFHRFFLGVQMVVVGNYQKAACELGAAATNHNESAAVPTFTDAERIDAEMLAKRLVAAATAMRPLIER